MQLKRNVYTADKIDLEHTSRREYFGTFMLLQTGRFSIRFSCGLDITETGLRRFCIYDRKRIPSKAEIDSFSLSTMQYICDAG